MQKKLEGIQGNTSGKIEQINNEMVQVKNQVVYNKENIEHVQHKELVNLKEQIESLLNRPTYRTHHTAPDHKENINFRNYRGNPVEFLERIDEWSVSYTHLDVYKRQDYVCYCY